MESTSVSSVSTQDYQGEDQYKDIAKEYKKSKMLPFRTESETPTFMNLLGKDLGSQNICDLACGEGFYTRQYRNLTAGRVVGVDISENMIKLAQQQEELVKRGVPIEYRVDDCCNLIEEFRENFDIVTATYLLNYATKKEMISGFTNAAFQLLKPGGRLVGINTSPFIGDQE